MTMKSCGVYVYINIVFYSEPSTLYREKIFFFYTRAAFTDIIVLKTFIGKAPEMCSF